MAKYLNRTGLGRVWSRARNTFADRRHLNAVACSVLDVSVCALYHGNGDSYTQLLSDNSMLDTLNRMWIDGERISLNLARYFFSDLDEHYVWFKVEGSVVPPGLFAGADIVEASVGGFITAIDDGAFHNADRLSRVLLSTNVTGIGNEAFSGCGVNEFICLAPTPPAVGTDSFGHNGLNATLYVVDNAAVDAYTAAGWYHWFDNIKIYAGRGNSTG